MMSCIDSYARKKLNDTSPLLLFSMLYDKDVPDIFGISSIEPDDINLSKSLISK